MCTKDILLTVILPFYNSEKTIESALKSIDFSKCIEVLCINDGSSDKSVDVVRRYKKKYKNIKILNFVKNMGVSYARNFGLKEAKSDWITFLDADDQFVNFTKIYNDLLTTKPSFIDLILYDHLADQRMSYNYGLTVGHHQSIDVKNLMISYFQNPIGNSLIPHCWSKIYNLHFLRNKNIIFNPDLQLYEDTIFVIECMKYSSNIHYKDMVFYSHSSMGGLGKSYEARPGDYKFIIDNLKYFSDDKIVYNQANGVFFAKLLAISRTLGLGRRLIFLRKLVIAPTDQIDVSKINDPIYKYLIFFKLIRLPFFSNLILFIFRK